MAVADLARWLALELREVTKKYWHLVVDSRDFAKKPSSLHIPNINELSFVKIDVKDFYMSGSADDLVRDSTCLLPHHKRELCADILYLLLASQWISTGLGHHKNVVWNVTQGSGMGLPHSGDVADLALLARAECTHVVNPAVMQDHGIIASMRFRDDILILASNKTGTAKFIHEMKNYAAISSLSLRKCTMSGLGF